MKAEDLDVYGIYHEIQSLDLELEQLRDLNFYRTTSLSDMPKGSKKKDKLVHYVYGVCQVEDMITYSVNALIKKRKVAEEYINKIKSRKIRAIFRYRCINGKSWNWIESQMGINVKTLKKWFYEELGKEHND